MPEWIERRQIVTSALNIVVYGGDGWGVTVEDVLEVAPGHVLVHHEPVLAVGAVADERDQVGVV